MAGHLIIQIFRDKFYSLTTNHDVFLWIKLVFTNIHYLNKRIGRR